ncbi:hypothetical protein BABINDRAFT_161506 [Babjeviella inositovora NRRL Y-12698]|uniref:Aminoacyl-transfer RNA synthetases class-II family profile domain-containing protein n=1 Tax=Babjeviella inositovora NRRL Y-12698 TaxID=984486 RepID=A0A1E3QQ37_9ASCO|nr:uncharacterized protein BABINDRAFT_161506 [Babjeviella inositovora NRRL Y-12698]ODQ79819.1 hypothetical protein BABINDRAFT_161506 [Babjeviella inositovora NRRL Y-12698]
MLSVRFLFRAAITRTVEVHAVRPLSSRPTFFKPTIPLPLSAETLPKFTFPAQTHTVAQVSTQLAALLASQQSVTLHGWIDKKPLKISKNLVFGEIRDINGELNQFLCKNNAVVAQLRRETRMEDAVCITGTVQRRRAKLSESTEGSSWDLVVTGYQTLNRAAETAAQLDSCRGKPELIPPQYRYLQLRLPFYQRALKARAAASYAARAELTAHGFTEVETPLLFKSTPEGAREFLVPTRKHDQFYALPQSPQQYKQLLMASGVHRYFQIAKCFRDEDLRADRQPEFTQIDLEMAFAGAHDVQRAVEKLVARVWRDVRALRFYVPVGDFQMTAHQEGTPFPQLTYNDALAKYGIDKPDLRSSLTFDNLSRYATVKNVPEEFTVFEVCVLRQAFDASQKCVFDKTLNDPLQYKARQPRVIPIKSATDATSWTSAFSEIVEFKPEMIAELHEKLRLQPGDIIAGSTRAEVSYENPTPLGRFRQIAIAAYPEKWQREIVARDDLPAIGNESDKVSHLEIFVACWVVNFPLFSPIDGDVTNGYPAYLYDQFCSTHHPFTMAHPDDYSLLATDPLRVRGEHYDLVVNGVELGGGSRRVHDSELQRYIFQEILRIENPDRLFGHLLHALSLGCPPHAGLAIGFDRMCAMLIGSSSIRDVVAFPKTMAGGDAVVGSPATVSDAVLKHYHVSKSKA